MSLAWDYKLQVRSMNGASPVNTYIPSAATVAEVDIAPEPLTVEFELLDYSRSDDEPGYYRHYVVTLETTEGHLAGSPASLETVLSDRFPTGYTLAISLNNGSSWVAVRVAQDSGPRRLNGKRYIGIHREIEFVSTSLLTADAAPDALD